MSKPDVQPHTRRLRRRAASLLAATALLAAACGDSNDTDETSAPDTVVDTTTAAPATGSPAATPFDRTDVICEKHSPPAGTRNSSSPGVTADAIVISDASPDVAALKKVGVELIDHHLAWQAVVDTINEDCGGINGRKIILESALLDPLSADMPAHFQATCLKITEDQKAFLALGTTGGPPMARCIAVDHKTIYDNPAYPIDADMRDSEGRVMSMFNTGESLARAFIADGAAGNAFDGKKIMVLGVAGPTPLAAQQQQVQYVDGFKTHDIDVDLELLPCAGADCTQGIGNAIRRIKQEAPDLLVFSHYLSGVVLGPVLREMRDQELEVVITGPANQSMSDGVMGTIMKAAGEDAVKWAADNGWTAVGDYQAGEGHGPGAVRVQRNEHPQQQLDHPRRHVHLDAPDRPRHLQPRQRGHDRRHGRGAAHGQGRELVHVGALTRSRLLLVAQHRSRPCRHVAVQLPVPAADDRHPAVLHADGEPGQLPHGRILSMPARS
jgi:hypothetical protein